jgi:Predicted membrane protein
MIDFIDIVLGVYIVLMNSYLFCLMWYDKKQAVKHQWRIPERRLLCLGLLGGGLGGILGRRIFRHKTKKPVFLICFLIGILVIVILLWLDWRRK